MILAFSIADLIRVPFGYLMDFLYQFTSTMVWPSSCLLCL